MKLFFSMRGHLFRSFVYLYSFIPLFNCNLEMILILLLLFRVFVFEKFLCSYNTNYWAIPQRFDITHDLSETIQYKNINKNHNAGQVFKEGEKLIACSVEMHSDLFQKYLSKCEQNQFIIILRQHLIASSPHSPCCYFCSRCLFWCLTFNYLYLMSSKPLKDHGNTHNHHQIRWKPMMMISEINFN